MGWVEDNGFDCWDMYDEPYDMEPDVLVGAKVVHETKKALLIKYGSRTAWFPKKVVYEITTTEYIEIDGWFTATWSPMSVGAIEGEF